MFFIPLSQIESVELVIHCLKVAGGEADCRGCPASKVCTKQCLTIARAIEQMFGEEVPCIDDEETLSEEELAGENPRAGEGGTGGRASTSGKSHLTLVKS